MSNNRTCLPAGRQGIKNDELRKERERERERGDTDESPAESCFIKK
jgi:hypothetical protein